MDGKGLRDAAGKLWDAVAPSVADAVTDVRQKVIEEPWFGRAVTPELVKEIDQPSVDTSRISPEASPPGDGGVHGKAEPDSGAPGREAAPKPGAGPPDGGPSSMPGRGQSFAEALADRYSWGKDFLPAAPEAGGHGKEQTQDHGIDR